jgi:stringent starvation protein B
MHEDSPSKEAVILKLLTEGDTMLCLDARVQGVRVPPQLAHNPALRLVLNLNFPHPIDVTAAGVSANLSFGGRRFTCYMPMEAIWAVFNPHTMAGRIWPESAAPEVLADLQAQQQQAIQQPQSGKILRLRPTLKAEAAREEVEQEDRAEAPEAAAPATPRQRGHLRIVK